MFSSNSQTNAKKWKMYIDISYLWIHNIVSISLHFYVLIFFAQTDAFLSHYEGVLSLLCDVTEFRTLSHIYLCWLLVLVNVLSQATGKTRNWQSKAS